MEKDIIKTNIIGIVDVPNPRGSKDTLDIDRHADALTEFIENTSTPMTIGIQGEWGSGKTSLLNAIVHSLEKKPEKYLQIWINSWEHSLLSTPEEALLKIINEIINEMLSGDTDKSRKDNIRNVTGSLIKGALRVGAAVVGGSKAGDEVEKLLGDSINSIRELRDQLENLALEIKNRNVNPYEKIIIYVDDLDRIEPRDAVQVLELLKNIFSIPNCVFVLAIDYQVVVKGLKEKFGERTEENEWEFRAFFDKIIQLPFMMPIGQYNKGKYVKDLLKQIGFIKDEDQFEKEQINDILTYSIGGNPRSLKRLVNSLTLINLFSKIDSDSNDDGENEDSNDTEDLLLFSLVCLQISYPKIYDLLVKHPDFPNWNEEIAFRVTQKKEEGIKSNEKEKFQKQFELAKKTDDFDEGWEKALYRICYLAPRYISRVKDISRLLSYLKDVLLVKYVKEGEIKDIITRVISKTAVTNISTSDEQPAQQRPGQRTMYSGFDEWKQTQIENMPKQSKARQFASVRLEIQELLHNECSNFFNDNAGFEWKYSKTGGCTGYADKKKFLAITAKGSKGAAINILKDFERDYRLPNIDGFITTHIRPYNPENPNILIGFCEQFRITAPSNENNPFELFKNNLSILLKLISRSYDLATIHRDKIMKELKDPATQEDLDRQKVYLGPDYQYDY
jgi:hypothetical protein